MRIVLALVCMVSVAAADVPTTNVDVEQAHTRYLLRTGKGLTGTAITLGVLAFGLGLGLAPVTFMGDHPLRDFVAVPLSCSLAGLSAIFITIGAPIWGAGERAERRAKTKVVVAANGLQVAF